MTADRVPPLDSDAGSVQVERIAAALRAQNFRATVITDSLHEPVAVHISDVFTGGDVAPLLAGIAPRAQDELARVENAELGHVLPYGMRSGMVYPRGVCDVMDIAVQAITGRADVVASRLQAPEGGVAAGIGDSFPHTDFPGNTDDPEITEVHGFNVHVTIAGAGVVRFSPVRSFAQTQQIADMIQDSKRAGRSVIDINETFPAVYSELMALAGEPTYHSTGDLLLFQARPHRRKGLLPMVHHFETRTDDRMINVFVPKAEDRAAIVPRRLELIERLDLSPFGYARYRPIEIGAQ
ncbi:hypothetical protein [Nocardia rhamnosiphila]